MCLGPGMPYKKSIDRTGCCYLQDSPYNLRNSWLNPTPCPTHLAQVFTYPHPTTFYYLLGQARSSKQNNTKTITPINCSSCWEKFRRRLHGSARVHNRWDGAGCCVTAITAAGGQASTSWRCRALSWLSGWMPTAAAKLGRRLSVPQGVLVSQGNAKQDPWYPVSS